MFTFSRNGCSASQEYAAVAWTVKCELLETIKRAFDTARIEIPYAYQNVILNDYREKVV